MNKKNDIQLALYSAMGAIAPDVLLLYSKRWTMPQLTFDPWLYAVVTVFYVILAGFVATIFPYKIFPQKDAGLNWKAFCIGVSLPVVVSGLATLGHEQLVIPRGSMMPGSILDLIALF